VKKPGDVDDVLGEVAGYSTTERRQVLHTIPPIVVLDLTEQRIAGTVQCPTNGTGAVVVVKNGVTLRKR
jgi:hypothetical protein